MLSIEGDPVGFSDGLVESVMSSLDGPRVREEAISLHRWDTIGIASRGVVKETVPCAMLRTTGTEGSHDIEKISFHNSVGKSHMLVILLGE